MAMTVPQYKCKYKCSYLAVALVALTLTLLLILALTERKAHAQDLTIFSLGHASTLQSTDGFIFQRIGDSRDHFIYTSELTVALFGGAISSSAPSNHMVLAWNSSTAQYEPVLVSNVNIQDGSITTGKLTLGSTNTFLASDGTNPTSYVSVGGVGGVLSLVINSGTATFTTLTNTRNFINSGALTCGASTNGSVLVHTTPLQYCDNSATPTLRYSAYADSSGNALTLVSSPAITTPSIIGAEQHTAIAAPSTPAAGVGSVYVDSTSKNLAVKDDAGVIKHGTQTCAATAFNWITAINDAGACTKAQPAFTDISGIAAIGQIPTGTTSSTVALGNANVNGAPGAKYSPDRPPTSNFDQPCTDEFLSATELGTWRWGNQGGASQALALDTRTLTVINESTNLRTRWCTPPTATDWTFTVKVSGSAGGVGTIYGVSVLETGTEATPTAMSVVGWNNSTTSYYTKANYTAAYAGAVTQSTSASPLYGQPWCFQVRYTNSSKLIAYLHAADCETWSQIQSKTLGAAPVSIGTFLDSNSQGAATARFYYTRLVKDITGTIGK